ncbi:glycosyltransferase [Pelagicoccus enzymogenes]|uniref:CgeB family protein n=1 Tax=Pelagicoccus enzymogenes TaxID=2773457 RepID=UPI00280F6931|nr:glycosyltransferase [Pelagicoccus enzymogenes]MDQ8199166.1 glycosyltransferase [Pelagicoccus enzymogenes]
MKILKVCSLNYYPVVADFYRRNLWIRDLPYAQHKQFLLDFSPVHLNRFSEYMRGLGYECDEVVTDLESLQFQWAKENGFDCPQGGWRMEILLKQIETIKPDLLYFQDISTLPPAIRRRLKNYYPFLKGTIVYRGFPIYQPGLEDVDLLLTGAANLLEEYNKQGIAARFLPHAFEAKVLDKVDAWRSPFHGQSFDFSFLGYSGHGGYGTHHRDRLEFLRNLLRDTQLECWLAEQSEPEQSSEPPLPKQFPNRCHPGLMGLDMYQVLQQSKVVFNKHSSAHPGQVENMRLFEATGIGTCLLTDYGDNLSSLFELDHELVAYHSYEECIEKLNYLLDHPKARDDIAKAAQRRTLRDHTWEQRADAVDQYIKEVFKKA